MLVLSRKAGEKVVIAGDITVTITRVAGGRVTLGIEAPTHVRVVRGELGAKTETEPSKGEALQGDALQGDSLQENASQGNASQRDASQRDASQRDGSQRDASQRDAAVRRPASIERRIGRGRFVVSGQAAAN